MHSCEPKCERVDSYGDSQALLNEQASELLPLVREMVNVIELAVLKATANLVYPEKFPLAQFHEDSLEMLLYKRVSGLSELKQKVATNKVKAAIKNLDLLRESKYSNLSEAGLLDRLMQAEPIFEGASDLFVQYGKKFRKTFKYPGENPPWEHMKPEFDKLALRIHRVKCLEETDGLGDDEIELSSVLIQPNGATSKLGPQVISNEFDDGEEVYFGTWYYAFYDLWNPDYFSGFPKLCQCTFILSEVDNGGLPEMVQTIYDKIQGEVVVALEREVNPGGSRSGLLGQVVTAAAKEVLDSLFQLFKDWWGDDLFPPTTVGAMIPSFDARWNGSTISPEYSCYFREHGGLYRLDYSWQFVK